MPSKFEHYLRKAVYKLGSLLERLIQESIKLKADLKRQRGIKPVVAVKEQFSSQKILQLVKAAESEILKVSLPELRHKKALEIADGEPLLLKSFLHRGAQLSVAVEMGSTHNVKQGDETTGYHVKARVSALPFADESIDYLVARLATPLKGNMEHAVKELSRVLKPKSQSVIVDYHPYAQFSEPEKTSYRTVGMSLRGVEDCYKLCRKYGFRVLGLKEVFLDEHMRNCFSADEISLYRSYKGTPLLLALFVYKIPSQRKV
ncbi:MAG: hypothetical protein COX62_09025 [Deltaproteobacteria bacterium CG_4_10_14_0_2_um_filter_43_8]|nr:MAG: hypothetical protein COV43_04940 [Deltaproteobacteria bacterium CG11_big_fil_rev_8_21_14_0_20_42_23]PJA18220.1 MAG: hypothetical protein COX62_09025 [Deltaproteobacteria bacterium CG_4_10_14_0_2_um_filter_43_8]PJC65121.1 MAG: hypothetical protein CO021_01330 [Deltaproteobacteria bacterium CG_4_9_14_0_2_um_filter_42_21]